MLLKNFNPSFNKEEQDSAVCIHLSMNKKKPSEKKNSVALSRSFIQYVSLIKFEENENDNQLMAS